MTVTATHARRLVSITATAQILSVSARTVRRLIAAGDLDAVRVGRRTIRVKTESIDRLIDAHSINGWRGRTPEPRKVIRDARPSDGRGGYTGSQC